MNSPAIAQQDGDTKCGADGKVYRYYAYLHQWSGGSQDCDGRSSQRNSSRDEPEDGDTKCGADGKVYRYYAYLHQWSGGSEDCRR